jgi:hypothetical protein
VGYNWGVKLEKQNLGQKAVNAVESTARVLSLAPIAVTAGIIDVARKFVELEANVTKEALTSWMQALGRTGGRDTGTVYMAA